MESGFPATFVAHVKKGYDDRERHIKMVFDAFGISFEWMLDGDLPDITPEIFARYFREPMRIDDPATSCTLKHLLIYEQIVERNLPGALVVEDDIFLDNNFNEIALATLKELEEYHADEPVIISYEDTRLRFVERSRRKAGRYTYPGDRDRMAGCYYINRAAAQLMLDVARNEKFDLPIDLMHNRLLHSEDPSRHLTYLWCHPCIASQGSHNGFFVSGIDSKRTSITALKWRVRKFWREIVYFFR